MAFPEMQPWQYPPRLWALEGYPGGGKSTFAAQMKTPMLVIDADHRFREVLSLVEGRVYELSKEPVDHVTSNRIAALLAENMPNARIATIVVDSLSAIFQPLIAQAIMDNDAGKQKNQMAGWKVKAMAMRQLQDAVTCWGSDVLWIYHLRDVRDANARAQVKTSVTDTELERLKRSLNLRLRIVEQDGQRAIKVVWARRGNAGMTISDPSGSWAGMPARIEAAVYDDIKKGEKQAPGPAQADGSAGGKADGGSVPCYTDGSPVSNRAITAYRAYVAAEGKPPANVEQLRDWNTRQAKQPAEGRASDS